MKKIGKSVSLCERADNEKSIHKHIQGIKWGGVNSNYHA